MDVLTLLIIIFVIFATLYFAGRNTVVLMALVCVVSASLYIYGRTWRHPDGFVAADVSGQVQKGQVEVFMEQNPTPPYATDRIQSVDDYEYNMVFQNEGDRAMTKATRDRLMSKYPMDWSTQPPSSSQFQAGLASFKESFQNPVQQKGLSPFVNIDGSKMIPPDSLAEEMKEREILQTYKPKDPQSLTTYDAADAKDLIDKIYTAKGLIADVRTTGPNQFTIVGTRKINEKIVYEDEEQPAGHAASTTVPNAAAGEGTIVVPAIPSNTETQQGLDPFFTPGTKTRDGRWDYTRWTPGLERMFAPTEPQTNWY